ncbi:MAG: hypothetical protein EXR62_04445 [Chloroflexi bacterium]|nr:hypothetical protein [Chloroflexota bacterium]
MKRQRTIHPIEIFPAAYFWRQGAWQEVAQALPRDAWLLVLPGDNGKLRQMTLTLAGRLRERGKRVMVWTVGEKEVQ